MRTTDERIMELNRRLNQEKRKKKDNFRRLTVGLSFAVCLIIMVGVSVAMPTIMSYFNESGFTYSGPAASIFYDGDALGYVVIAILSFILGICATILCYTIKNKNMREKEGHNDGTD